MLTQALVILGIVSGQPQAEKVGDWFEHWRQSTVALGQVQ